MTQGLYPTFIDLCACLPIWQLNNISNFTVWCNLAGLLTKPEVVTVKLAVKRNCKQTWQLLKLKLTGSQL